MSAVVAAALATPTATRSLLRARDATDLHAPLKEVYALQERRDGARERAPSFGDSNPIRRRCVVTEDGFAPRQVAVAEFFTRVVRSALQRVFVEIDDIAAGRRVVI